MDGVEVEGNNSEEKINMDNLEIKEKKHHEPVIDEDGFEMVQSKRKK